MAYPDTEDDDAGMEIEAPKESDTKTALLPTEFFQGKELTPGTVCKVRVERVLEGQAEVSYVPHESEPEMGEEAGAETDEEMMGYMEG